jgi:putative aminopeptidase FrvX
VGILSLNDVEHCVRLLIEVAQKLDRATVDGLTRI